MKQFYLLSLKSKHITKSSFLKCYDTIAMNILSLKIWINKNFSCFSLIGYIIGCLNRYTVLENPLDTPLYMYISGFYPSTFVYSRFFPKIEFFYCLHEDALPTHFLALKHTLFIADKHLWILWFGNKVHKIPSPKFVHKSW